MQGANSSYPFKYALTTNTHYTLGWHNKHGNRLASRAIIRWSAIRLEGGRRVVKQRVVRLRPLSEVARAQEEEVGVPVGGQKVITTRGSVWLRTS